jgi:hypothetical protein
MPYPCGLRMSHMLVRVSGQISAARQSPFLLLLAVTARQALRQFIGVAPYNMQPMQTNMYCHVPCRNCQQYKSCSSLELTALRQCQLLMNTSENSVEQGPHDQPSCRC